MIKEGKRLFISQFESVCKNSATSVKACSRSKHTYLDYFMNNTLCADLIVGKRSKEFIYIRIQTYLILVF